MSLSHITTTRREQFTDYIHHELVHINAVRAVIAIGSIALDTTTPDSDIDAIVFLEPFEEYAVPAEAIWRKEDNSYHSIFDKVEGLYIDCLRLDLSEWRNPEFEWYEPRKAELATGWIAYDRNGAVTRLIEERTRFTDSLRRERLDDTLIWLDAHLGDGIPEQKWETLGAIVAHDRLNGAYAKLVRGIFALNRRWVPWRNRQMSALLKLDWLPDDFELLVMKALYATTADYKGYLSRVSALRRLTRTFIDYLKSEGLYGDDPVNEAFLRANDESGRAWNIAEWEREHRERYGGSNL